MRASCRLMAGFAVAVLHASAAATTAAAPGSVDAQAAPQRLSVSAIFLKAVTAVAQALSMAAIGFIFARAGVIDAQSRKVISFLSMQITIPCLLFASILDCPQADNTTKNMCPDLSESLAAAWPLLLLPFLWTGIGAAAGWVASLFAPPRIKRTAIAAVAFPNSTGLPITLLTALSQVSLTPGVQPAAQLRSFLLMLSIYQVTYPVLQWGLGGRILAEKPSESQELLEAGDRAPEPQELLEPGDCPQVSSQPKTCGVKLQDLLRAIFSPPVVAVCFGFGIGLSPRLRSLFVDRIDFDNDHALEFLFNAIRDFGQAAVPMQMMVLGASLASIPSFASIQWPATIAVTFGKLVVHPAVGFGIVYCVDAAGGISAIAGDQRPSLIIVACIMCACPTSSNMQVMAEVSGGPECKSALSAMTFLMYCFAPIVLTCWLVVAVSMAQV